MADAKYTAGDLDVLISGSVAGASKSLNTIIKKLGLLQNALTAIDTTNLKGMTNSLNEISGVGRSSGGRARGSGFSLLGFGKITAIYYTARRLARVTATIVQSGSDYTETLNLWQVAMRNNLTQASAFVKKMNEAYGISEKTLMNAQATFKNMIGSLGDLSESASYALSEAITQMAIDYSSLYNTPIQDAINKFQSALAGQVRPIRSISGYDITEKTIYAVYEALGGTKTMRQLSRTEKQLLSIYAVFNQMGASGALGDMTKTLGNFANQSRMLVENWSQLSAWTGVILTHLIEQSGIMVTLNAALIFASEVVKGIAQYIGAGQKNFLDDMFESAKLTNEQVDELQGKLLDFDKIRSLSGQENAGVQLDQKLLEAIAGYSSHVENANNQARELAKSWLIISGIFDEDGVLNPTKIEEIIGGVKTVGSVLLTLVAGGIIKNVANGFISIFSAVSNFASIFSFIKSPLGIIVALLGALYLTNEEFRTSLNGLLKAFLPIVNLLFGLVEQILPLLQPFVDLAGKILSIVAKIATGVVYFGSVILGFVILPIELVVKTVSTLLVLLDTLFNWKWEQLGSRLSSLWKNWGSVDFIRNSGAQLSNVLDYANGGLPDKGTVFRAGEAGAEIVYNTPSGQSGVANVQQIAQATYAGTTKALQDWWGGARGDIPQFREVSKTGIYEVVNDEANRRGRTISKR